MATSGQYSRTEALGSGNIISHEHWTPPRHPEVTIYTANLSSQLIADGRHATGAEKNQAMPLQLLNAVAVRLTQPRRMARGLAKAVESIREGGVRLLKERMQHPQGLAAVKPRDPTLLELFFSRLRNPRRALKSMRSVLFRLRTQNIAGVLDGIGVAKSCYIRDSGLPTNNEKVYTEPTNVLASTDISIPSTNAPLVSIIIPVYNNLAYTAACVASICHSNSKATYEIIIADDGSTDGTKEWCRSVKNLRYIATGNKQGFIATCNTAAQQATGAFLHFLNNDTAVTAQWLDELLHTFDEFPGTGFVGSKLVYPDGLLQEAGGILWRDGSAWNFGRLSDPNSPYYNYAREVDYCSGASIIVPAQLFHGLGGFDTSYAPAYCEDSDLALKIRNLGYRVIYQPLSTVIHYEGKTGGTDLSSGVKSYQVANTEKLQKRWRKYLDKLEVNGRNVDRAKDRRAKRRVLVLDHCTPTPDQDAGSVTVYNLLLLLREMDYQVTFIPEDNFLYMSAYTPQLQRVGIEALYAPYCTSVREHLEEHGERYDLVFLIRPEVVRRNLKQIRALCPSAKVLYHTIDLHYLRMERDAHANQNTGKLHQAEAMKNTEFAAIRASDATIVHSTEELRILRSEGLQEKLCVFPLILDTPGSKVGFGERDGIVFIGGFQHPPNSDAVKFMAGEIMPLLRELVPGIKFHVIGSKPTQEIRSLACDDIIIHGFVKDLSKELARRRVSVAPLRYGAGIKGKIGTAMAVGLPVVATSIAAEGMSLETGKNVLVADNAGAFAEAVAALYSDESLWDKVSKNSVQFAEKEWGAEAAFEIFSDILSELDQPVNRGRYPLSLYKPN
jgi:O-antigen biosynthesis protein